MLVRAVRGGRSGFGATPGGRWLTFAGGRCPPDCRSWEGVQEWLVVLPPSRPVGGAVLVEGEEAEEEEVLPSGPVGGALLALFPEPARLMDGAEPAEGEVLPPGPVGGALLALFPEPARLVGGAVLASGCGRGGMGVAVPLVKDGYRLVAVPLKSPTPQSSSRSACEAAPCCCALDRAALALSFAFTKNLAAESPG